MDKKIEHLTIENVSKNDIIEIGLELYKLMLKELKKQGKMEFDFGINLNELTNDSQNIHESISFSKESLEEILEGMEKIRQASENTKISLESGSQIIISNNDKISELNHQTKHLENLYKNYIKVFSELEERSKMVESILASINKVSYKINLLSLNASIEAARAGEVGRGFSVVAKEIKKLADDTHSLSKAIEENIGSVISGIKELSNETSDAFKDIEKISNDTENMSVEFQKLVDKDSVIVSQMEEVNQYSIQNNDLVEKINENFSRSFEDIKHMTKAMAEINNQRIDKDVFFNDFTSFLYQLEDLFKELKNYKCERE